MIKTPHHLQDTQCLLDNKGFAQGEVWYHGTSSALLDSIKKQGLKRSGDKSLQQAAYQSLSTIGHTYTHSTQPIFLSQSKELAYFWATQTVRKRSLRFTGNEEAIVLAVHLPGNLQQQVKPDVGAAGLLLIGGEHYLSYLAEIYKRNGLLLPNISPKTAKRMDYLNLLGMAYIDRDIAAKNIALITRQASKI